MIPGVIAAGAMGTGGVIPPSVTPYYDAVIADNPALYFRFAELSGDPTNSGSATTGACSYNASTRGQASLCGDSGDYSVAVSAGAGTRGPTIAHSSALLPPNNFTIEAIIYPTSLSGQHAISTSSAGDVAELRIISGKVNLIRKNTAVVAVASTTLSTNTRYHVACRVASDGTYTFFLNGATDGTGAGYASFNTGGVSYVGYEDIGSNAFVGRIDEWAFYTSALSDARIAAHAAAMAP